MGMRGYIIGKLEKISEEKELWEITKSLESIPEVTFAENITGVYDFILTVDINPSSRSTFENVVDEIKKRGIFKEIISLKENDILIKHREMLDLKILEELSN